MARWRRGTTEESAAVPGPRNEPPLPPEAGADDPADGAEQGSGAVLGDSRAEGASEPVSDSESVPAAEQTRPDPPVPGEDRAVLTEDGPQTAARPARPQDHKIHHTRLSGTWAAIVVFAIVLVLLLIFILQNGHTVDVSYMGAHGHLPLGVALLLAAVAGILLVAMAGSARIMQLRATARKHRRTEVRAAKSDAKAAKAEAKAARKAEKARS